ncbi:DUF721 domain-containing protein [Methylobacterium sp. A54F]
MARVKPLAELIEGCIGPAFAAQGFASTDILAAWPDIVGARLARYAQPSRIEWPRRRRRDGDGRPDSGTLVVRVEGVFAVELQHLAPVVIERINAHYGWACIHRLVLQQGRMARPGRRAEAAALDPARRGEVALAVSRVADDALRDALDRLGTAVVAGSPAPPKR